MKQNKQEATELGEKEKSDAKDDTDFELEAAKETKAIQGQEVNQKRENQGDQKIWRRMKAETLKSAKRKTRGSPFHD